jgi:proteic killer suppression protein
MRAKRECKTACGTAKKWMTPSHAKTSSSLVKYGDTSVGGSISFRSGSDGDSVSLHIDALRMGERVCAIGGGIPNVINQRSADSVHAQQMPDSLCNLMIGAGGVPADPKPSDNLGTSVRIQRHASTKENQAACDLIATASLPARPGKEVRIKLRILEAATSLRDLAQLPSNHLEARSGDRKGQYSIQINRQWRICFTWPGGADGSENVEIVDYH